MRLGERSVGHLDPGAVSCLLLLVRAWAVDDGPVTDREALLARIDALERERRRAFDEAQREADALFAQYQLSQLIASGGSLAELGGAVALRARPAWPAPRLGALWLGRAGDRRPTARAAGRPGALDGSTRPRLGAGPPAAAPSSSREEPPRSLLVVWSATAGPLDADGLRVAQLARHELAVAFAGRGCERRSSGSGTS